MAIVEVNQFGTSVRKIGDKPVTVKLSMYTRLLITKSEVREQEFTDKVWRTISFMAIGDKT